MLHGVSQVYLATVDFSLGCSALLLMTPQWESLVSCPGTFPVFPGHGWTLTSPAGSRRPAVGCCGGGGALQGALWISIHS